MQWAFPPPRGFARGRGAHRTFVMTDRYKTARVILYRDDRYLLAVHQSFWRTRDKRWGLPGGQIERGEAPAQAAQRELREELYVRVSNVLEVGAFSYKSALHAVFAAPWHEEIRDFDDMELDEIGWFDEAAILSLKRERRLHAGWELEAVQTLRRLLDAARAPGL